jgi:hypothetical protein
MSNPIILLIGLLTSIIVGLVFFSRLRIRTITLIASAVATGLVGTALLLSHCLDRTLEAWHGPPHVFQLSEHPLFLSEDLALEKARSALVLDGFGQDYQPVPDGRTSAPNGRQDVYLVRNTKNPNDGWLIFTNTTGERLDVSIELTGQRLMCRRIALK